LLSTTRQQLTAYARQHTLSWIEDESNQDTRFSRNLMRLKVLPLLKTRWPSVVKQLLQVAEHCHDAQQNLDALARLDYPELDVTGDCLDTASLADLSDSRINNVLRAWLTHRGIKSPSSKTFARFIPEVMRAASDKTPCVAWDGIEVRRYQTALYILREPHVFKPPLLQINLDATGVYIPPSSRVEVRFREGGEQLVWRGKTRRLKDLMNQWRILPWMRDKIPLMYIDGQLAVVVGWCIADTHYREEGEFLYHITQQAYGSDYNAA
jgi:tRNA(Ile)-lysidine synthase